MADLNGCPVLVYRQDVAFPSCLLQVWQHWPLRWSVEDKIRLGMEIEYADGRT